jgi:hypothetical protein
MGWLEFFANIINALAWPGVVLIFLWYNRERLAKLFGLINELTLPGGTGVKFNRALDKASVEAKLLSSEAPDVAHINESHLDSQASSDVAKQFPEAFVVQGFLGVVETLGEMVRFLALPTKGRDPESVVRELARLGYIDQNSVDLFSNLQDAYTAAVREGYVRLTAEKALRYRQAAQALNTQLRKVLPRLEADNPRKRQWGLPEDRS